MKSHILALLFVPCLLLGAAAPGLAAPKGKKNSKAEDYKAIPAFNWNLAATGFLEVFRMSNREIESAEPNRFFPGSVAFALGRIDESGHYLMLRCSASGDCGSMRDSLEERLVYSCLLQVVRTPKVAKEQLYDSRTYALTPLGEKYIENLRRRYPDLNARLARLVAGAFAGR